MDQIGINRLGERQGSTAFNFSAHLPAGMVLKTALKVVRAGLLLLILLNGSALLAGCGSMHHDTIDEPVSMARPAQSLSEEETWADRAGEVAIVVLIVAGTVGGILLPIFLF